MKMVVQRGIFGVLRIWIYSDAIISGLVMI
jgi:hypothetical protein